MAELERTVWTHKIVEENELSNKMLEVILNFYEKAKFEMNINKFSSKFDIDLDAFLDNTNQDEKTPMTDDVFQSDYHHSLILGNYCYHKDNILSLTIEKVFTNEQELYSEKNKEFKIFIDSNSLTLENNNVISNIIGEAKSIILTLLKPKSNGK